MKKLSNDLIGIAGVHYIVHKLSLRGLVALPTMRNTGGIDILVSARDGRKLAALQVKSSQNWVRFWPMPKPEKVTSSNNLHFVFMRYDDDSKDYEAFLVPSAVVKRQVTANHDDYKRRKKAEFNYFAILEEDEREYKQAWKKWQL